MRTEQAGSASVKIVAFNADAPQTFAATPLLPVFDALTLPANGYFVSYSAPRSYVAQPFSTEGLTAGTIRINGVDLVAVAIATRSYSNIRISVQFWNGFNAAANPIFSSPVGGAGIGDSGPIFVSAGQLLDIRMLFSQSVLLAGAANHGVSINVKTDTGTGLQDSGEVVVAARVNGGPYYLGTVPLPSPAFGFYRNVSGRTDLNFLSSDLSTLNGVTYNGLAIRLLAPSNKGDFNGDNATDLLLRNTSSGGLEVWLMNGITQIQPVSTSPQPPSAAWDVAGVADFDLDHKNDLILRNNTTGEIQIWLMDGTTRVGPPVALVSAPSVPPDWRLSATADFDWNGLPDLLWRSQSTQQLQIWKMFGNQVIGTITPSPSAAVDANWEIAAALDYNNDDTVDLLWYNPSSGKIVLWFMNAAVVRTSGLFTVPPNAGANNWRVLAGGDFGVGSGGVSGSNDIVWRNATSGKYVVWYMDFAGNRTFGTFTSPSSPPVAPTVWTIAGPR